jgi:AhpD family alkylhydroperoxidase
MSILCVCSLNVDVSRGDVVSALFTRPAVVGAYLSYNRALSHGALPARIREQIALVAPETNGCDYCASAHTAIGKHVGLSQDDITKALEGRAVDPKAEAAVRFAKLLLQKRARISNSNFSQLQQARFSEAEIAEIVAHVAMNVFDELF